MRPGLLCIAIALAIFLSACSGTLRNATSDNALPQSVGSTARAPGKTTKKSTSNPTGCPNRAIFIRRYGEIRAYPLDASGETAPCAIISGAQTNLSDNLPYGNIAVSANGFLHALSFQANDTRVLTIDAPDANGNALPRQLVSLSPDAVALAIDSNLTDYVVASENYQGDNCWFVVPSGATNPTSSNCDTNLSAIVALAVDKHGNLVATGPDALTGNNRIDFISNPATSTFAVARTIEGSETRIGPNASIALAVAPVSGDLYVFSRTYGNPAFVSVFPDGSTGNIDPSRAIVGSNAHLPQSAFAVNVLAVDDAGFLYVTSDAGAIFVYDTAATGDAVPVRQITDSNAASPIFAAGIALRL